MLRSLGRDARDDAKQKVECEGRRPLLAATCFPVIPLILTKHHHNKQIALPPISPSRLGVPSLGATVGLLRRHPAQSPASNASWSATA